VHTSRIQARDSEEEKDQDQYYVFSEGEDSINKPLSLNLLVGQNSLTSHDNKVPTTN
jgi:hypothetical protein